MKKAILFNLLLSLSIVASGQVKDSWEYLVITPGKALYSSVEGSDPKRSSALKIARYGESVSAVAQEAQGVEIIADSVGKAGWELVAIIGQIGGDQEWVFKRRYSQIQTTAEMKEAQKLAAEVGKIQAANDKKASDRESTVQKLISDAKELPNSGANEMKALISRLISELGLQGTVNITEQSVVANIQTSGWLDTFRWKVDAERVITNLSPWFKSQEKMFKITVNDGSGAPLEDTFNFQAGSWQSGDTSGR